MRIHTDTLSRRDLERAARIAHVTIIKLEDFGSRSHDHAFEVRLSGSSRFHTNLGNAGAGSFQAATWDEWGVFMDELFRQEESLVFGPYKGREDFVRQTTAEYLRVRDNYPATDLYRRTHAAPWLQSPQSRLEYLRGELRAERISYGELVELQGLAEHIPADDLELREAAGLPE